MLPSLNTDTAMSALDVVIAHQGWDELLLFGAPVVLAILAVRWAERRSKSRQGEAPGDSESADRDAAGSDSVHPDSAETGATDGPDPGGPGGPLMP